MSNKLPLSQQEFDKWLSELQYIIFDCHISIRNLEKITARRITDHDWRPVSGFLDHLRTQYYFTLITQLAKLFCDGKQDLRFNRLIGRLNHSTPAPFIKQYLLNTSTDVCRSRMSYCWNDEIAMKQGLSELQARLHVFKSSIVLLKRCRDENIAHVSPKSNPENPVPSISELSQLVALSDEVFTAIRSGLGMPHIGFDSDHSWSIEPIFNGWCDSLELHNLGRQLRLIHPVGHGEVYLEYDHKTGSLTIQSPRKGHNTLHLIIAWCKKFVPSSFG